MLDRNSTSWNELWIQFKHLYLWGKHVESVCWFTCLIWQISHHHHRMQFRTITCVCVCPFGISLLCLQGLKFTCICFRVTMLWIYRWVSFRRSGSFYSLSFSQFSRNFTLQTKKFLLWKRIRNEHNTRILKMNGSYRMHTYTHPL